VWLSPTGCAGSDATTKVQQRGSRHKSIHKDLIIRRPPGDWGGFPQPRVVQRESYWPVASTGHAAHGGEPDCVMSVIFFWSCRDQRPRRSFPPGSTGCAAESGPLLSAAWLGLRRRVSVTARRGGHPLRRGSPPTPNAPSTCPRSAGPLRGRAPAG